MVLEYGLLRMIIRLMVEQRQFPESGTVQRCTCASGRVEWLPFNGNVAPAPYRPTTPTQDQLLIYEVHSVASRMHARTFLHVQYVVILH